MSYGPRQRARESVAMRVGQGRPRTYLYFVSFFCSSFICSPFSGGTWGKGDRGAPLGRYGSLWVAPGETGRGRESGQNVFKDTAAMALRALAIVFVVLSILSVGALARAVTKLPSLHTSTPNDELFLCIRFSILRRQWPSDLASTYALADSRQISRPVMTGLCMCSGKCR